MTSQISFGKTLAMGALVLLSTVLSTVTPTSAATAQCGSGTGDSTLNVSWNGGDSFTVTPKKALTKETKLFASSYILTSPDYKGGCFSYDPKLATAPQTEFQTVITVLPVGQVAPIVVTVPMPDKCNNVQVDLYYGKNGQKLSTVGQRGHDEYGYLAGNIVQPFSTTACVPGRGGEIDTPATTVTPAAVESAAVVAPAPELADTGISAWVISSTATILALASAFVATRRNKTEA